MYCALRSAQICRSRRPVPQARHTSDTRHKVIRHRALRERDANFGCGLGEAQIGIWPEKAVKTGWRDRNGNLRLSVEDYCRDVARTTSTRERCKNRHSASAATLPASAASSSPRPRRRSRSEEGEAAMCHRAQILDRDRLIQVRAGVEAAARAIRHHGRRSPGEGPVCRTQARLGPQAAARAGSVTQRQRARRHSKSSPRESFPPNVAIAPLIRCT